MNNEQAQAAISDLFRKKVQLDPKIHNAYLLVHSDKLGVNLKMAEGATDGASAHADQPFYIASISKLFTAVLYGIMVEKNIVSYEDPISKYLDQELLHNLHVYKGKDYTGEIRIKHLLNNTSGLNDFMEDKPKQGKSIIDLVLEEPSRVWTPREIVMWSKEHLKSHFPPGRGFHYSDTGYHLLGLIMEKITNMPFHEVLQQHILGPLQMNNSYFCHHSEPKERSEHPVANLYLRNVDVTRHKSLSIIFAGGGVVSTTEDLLKFMRALVHGHILKEDTIVQMKKDWARFFLGIDYGYGVMNIKTVPLFMPSKFNAWGNAGSTGTFMFYNPATDAYIIGGFNQSGYGQKGIRFMFQVVDKLSKIGK